MPILTDFLKLFKWNTDSETDLEEEFDIDTSMNGNWDILDTKAKNHEDRINTLEDVQAEQDSLIQKLKDNMINLTTEEDTSLYIDDASVVPAKLKIMGNHYQETQEGTENLAVLNEGSITQDGITVDIENGEATMSGTNTSGAVSTIKIGTAYLYQGQTYYFKRIGAASNSGNYISISGISTQHWFADGNAESNFVCEKTGEWSVYASVGENQTTSGTFKLMLSKESGAEWVQGKKTIPSLEYPSEIETVGNNVNYFNKDLPLISGYLTTDGSLVQSSLTSHTESYTPVEANTQYTLSGLVKGTVYSIYRIYFWDKDKNWISKSEENINSATYTFTTPEGTAYIDYQISNALYAPNKDKIKLEKGDKVTAYSPYNQGCVEIKKINSNIMPISGLGTDWEYTVNGIKNLARNNGKNITSFNLKKGQTVKLNFKLFSKPTVSTTFTTYVDGIEKRDIMFVGFNEYILNQVYTRTYTATEDCELRITLWGNANSETFEFQLWANIDEVEDYVQYAGEEYILDVQQEMLKGDDFDLENDKEVLGYEKKNMSEIDWVVSSNQLQEKTYCFMVMYSVAGLLSTEINCFSNCFKSLTGSYLFANDEEGIAQSTSQIVVRIGKEKVADLNAFKALLAEKNAVVYVKNPSQLDLTETQKQQLNQLNNLGLFKGINNIYTEENIALMQLDYVVDTKMYIDKMLGSEG